MSTAVDRIVQPALTEEVEYEPLFEPRGLHEGVELEIFRWMFPENKSHRPFEPAEIARFFKEDSAQTLYAPELQKFVPQHRRAKKREVSAEEIISHLHWRVVNWVDKSHREFYNKIMKRCSREELAERLEKIVRLTGWAPKPGPNAKPPKETPNCAPQ